ncbi:winged helix-turn-helix transcriptional regulator [Acanthopleuribacter pedis]|uniref:Helix-turn-helix transcriptional regulator n=1 Tax=Acanthopleuribacter pedis TaxID=442870 RepID=A0A8J7QE52_9BACT|nr:helix-turn-helix domain-containing protein [Acanthopleuribacter pedis]MBO1317453.1 helix-turn-helix transcriptional regulator [Acanthopleuribacter pedis]
MSRRVAPSHIRPIVETILGCKWSLTLMVLIRQGVHRPGQMHRSVDGLSPKVMNYCLAKMLEFNLVEKTSYPEIPPRVEYHFTPFGLKFMKLFDVLEELDGDLAEAVKGATRN